MKVRGGAIGQGVIIPASNAAHLMVRQDVVEAAADGRFHVRPVTTVDQAIELLTGMPPTERDAGGRFPQDSFNDLIETNLVMFAELHRDYASPRAEALTSG